MFATTGSDNKVCLWKVAGENFEQVKASLSAKKEVTCAKFSRDSSFMAYGSNDMGVRLCDIANQRVRIFLLHFSFLLRSDSF